MRPELEMEIWKDQIPPKGADRFVDDVYYNVRKVLQNWKETQSCKESSASEYLYKTVFKRGKVGAFLDATCLWCFIGSFAVFIVSFLTKITDLLLRFLLKAIKTLFKKSQ